MSVTETKPETIEIVATPELAQQLAAAEAAGKRPILVRDGVKYQLDPVEAEVTSAEQRDIWADYDPAKVHAAIEEIAGIITLEEAEEAIANIYRWRQEGSRPWNEPE